MAFASCSPPPCSAHFSPSEQRQPYRGGIAQLHDGHLLQRHPVTLRQLQRDQPGLLPADPALRPGPTATWRRDMITAAAVECVAWAAVVTSGREGQTVKGRDEWRAALEAAGSGAAS